MLLPATTPGLCTQSALERPRVGIRSIAVVTLSYRNLVSSGDVVTTATEMKSIAVHSMLKNTGGFFEVWCAGSRPRAAPVQPQQSRFLSACPRGPRARGVARAPPRVARRVASPCRAARWPVTDPMDQHSYHPAVVAVSAGPAEQVVRVAP